MLNTNFTKLNVIGDLINDLNFKQIESILQNKEYLQLTKIEYKYYDALTNAKKLDAYYKIRADILQDFGEHKPLLKYLMLIFKEKYLLGLYRKTNHELLVKTYKLQIIIQLFISTIRYGDKILMRPGFKDIEPDAVVANFRLYAIMINPQYLYRYLGILTFSQAKILKKLLHVEVTWDVDATNAYLDLDRNDYLALKVFNLEKEIIRETTASAEEEKREYGMLMYHTYMKLIINFIAKNIENS
jgi:hypothetical protein